MANNYNSIQVKHRVTGEVVFEIAIHRFRYHEAIRDRWAERIAKEWCGFNHADPEQYCGEVVTECSAKAAREARHGLPFE